MANFSKPQSIMAMLFAFFAFLQFTTALQHGNHHMHHAPRSEAALESRYQEITDALAKRQGRNYIAITGVCNTGLNREGVCNSNGRASYPRLEIRQLRNNADQWNLYLLGMERFMSKSQNDDLSYYAIAGIHGRPFKSWGNFPTPLVNQAGFCPHSQVLFGSWHRPYLAVFEQAWYLSVQEVISQFPSNQQQRWRNAAATLRMPYWDWAQVDTSQPHVPTLIRDQRVTVTKPSGTVSIANPLYSYSFGSSLPREMGGAPWNSWPQTLRRPVANPTRSNNNEMNARFNNIRISLRDRIYALFASKQSWGHASTSQIGVRTDLSGSGVDSFESVHDAIHNTAGGETGGHMYYLDISSFDPIFWLHHTNVDRLLAMYQLTVDTWVANGNINRPMAQWNQGEPKNSYTPLKPFTKDNRGNYFTSVDIRETRTLGYYYPETSGRSRSQVYQAVTRLYGAGRTLSKRDESTGQYLGREMREGDYHTVFSIVADKFVMDGSYTVHCFVGSPSSNYTANSTAPYPTNSTAHYGNPYTNSTDSEEPDYDPSKDFTNDPNYVGAYGILGGMKAGAGNATYPVMTEGCLPLTTALQGKEYSGELKSLKPEDVEPYLKENLHYKVIGPDGAELDPETIPNFHVYVKSTEVKVPSGDDELPDLSGKYEVLPEATKNKPAGKPFTYTPSPIDIALPEGPECEEPGYSENPTNAPMPWDEEGYCVTKQTINYVDPDGNFLYAEM